jgi:hypothetical protein
MIFGNLSQIDSPDQISYVTEGLPAWAKSVYNSDIKDKLKFVEPEGALYRTEIDVTPDQLLDWDKPFSQQDQNVKNALGDVFGEISERIRSRPQIYTSPVDDVIGNQTGADIYDRIADTKAYADWMSSQLTSGNLRMSEANTPSSVSKFLDSRGLKGIQYFDGTSRSAGEGTRNYVIFDDKPIRIAERGAADPRLLAGIAGGGLLAAAKRELYKQPISRYLAML